ncbi:MAG: glycoside hydrolase family 1 protein [Candidatus Sericytochromatia bacterium]|nr:glycoside hydrolase family 1 protein [Candidatus Tanganyikabacteria bacterium]
MRAREPKRRLAALAARVLLVMGIQACTQRPGGLPPGNLPALPGDPRQEQPSTVRSRFPQGFLWGVATAGHQVEGHDKVSNWAAWAEAGRTTALPGRATDSWNRYAEDFDLARGMGLNAFRFSIEWARIEPRPGVVDGTAVARYRTMIRAARARGLEPIVTLHHFAYPAWLDTYKQTTGGYPGWEDLHTAAAFEQFARFAAREFGPDVRYWITLNEPNTQVILGYLTGVFPPGKVNPGAASAVTRHMTLGHVLAYDAIHQEDPDAIVSTNFFDLAHVSDPAAVFPGDPAREMLDRLMDWQGLNLMLGRSTLGQGTRKLDFMAFDYYYAWRWTEVQRMARQWEWALRPEGLFTAMKVHASRTGLPLLIAENGMATDDGKPRADGWSREAFLVQHADQVRRAIAEGVPCLGYIHWSLLDNYEWGSYRPRFGLYEVDPRDPLLRRKSTPAVEAYRAIATGNDVPPSLLEQYPRPTARP